MVIKKHVAAWEIYAQSGMFDTCVGLGVLPKILLQFYVFAPVALCLDAVKFGNCSIWADLFGLLASLLLSSNLPSF